ncbi:MAG: bifunctional oligoribonuclease/PAP phosphatase NrnA [Hespellia sp.]|nr:bifunctional oligoribonuclease/PAP phosphatase NrnA [Hespellia sp.]
MNKFLLDTLEGMHSVAIGGHIRPDGDCVGSTTALYQYLKTNYPEIKTDLYLEQGFSETFRFIEATKAIKSQITDDMVYDLFICLDCSDMGRLGFSAPLFESAKHTLCIDHHLSNAAFAEHNYIIADASSTAELVYNMLEYDKITLEIAESLYLGMVHDTGVFQYSCTAPSTLEAAAQLLRKGIDASELIDKTYYEKTYVQNQILGRALLESILLLDGKCIASVVRKKELDFYGAATKDLEGIVSQLRSTTGVEVAIFLYELEYQEFKVSLRSKGNVDVSKIAEFFQGGGHKRAAGFSMKGTSYDVINNITLHIENQLSK